MIKEKDNFNFKIANQEQSTILLFKTYILNFNEKKRKKYLKKKLFHKKKEKKLKLFLS